MVAGSNWMYLAESCGPAVKLRVCLISDVLPNLKSLEVRIT